IAVDSYVSVPTAAWHVGDFGSQLCREQVDIAVNVLPLLSQVHLSCHMVTANGVEERGEFPKPFVGFRWLPWGRRRSSSAHSAAAHSTTAPPHATATARNAALTSSRAAIALPRRRWILRWLGWLFCARSCRLGEFSINGNNQDGVPPSERGKRGEQLIRDAVLSGVAVDGGCELRICTREDNVVNGLANALAEGC